MADWQVTTQKTSAPEWRNSLRVLCRTPWAVFWIGISEVLFLAALWGGLVPGARRFQEASLALAIPAALVGWPLVYLLVASVYLGTSIVREQRRRFFTRLSWCMAVTLLLAFLPGAYPGLREGYVYLRSLDLFYVAGCYLLVAMVFLRPETKAVARDLWRRAGKYPYVTWMVIVATVFYGSGELTLSMFAWFREPDLGWQAFNGMDKSLGVHAMNILLIVAPAAVVFGLTNRLVFSMSVGAIVYLAVLVGNLVKLQYLRTPIVPEDIHYTTELAHVVPRYLGAFGLGATALAAVLLAGWLAFAFRWRAGRAGALTRTVLAGLSVLLVVTVANWSRIAVMRALIDRMNVMFMDWRPEQSLRENGLVFESLLNIGRFRVTPPPGYSAAEVSRVLKEYGPVSHAADTRPDVNLIVCVVESFMDPDDLGVRFSSDPLPCFHRLRREHSSGYVVVPVFGGKSVNTEFELLTGLSTAFFPPSMCAYTGQITRDLPSLPRLLGAHGYRTTAVNAVTPAWFNYARVYRHLGFGETVWLGDRPGVPRDARTGLPSDDAVVDAVLECSRGRAPFFVYAFPCTTHSPYDRMPADAGGIEVLQPIPPAARSELKSYVNALRRTDRAVERIIDHFARSPRKTMVVILGDHLPPFFHGVWQAVDFFSGPELDDRKRRYSTPVVIWKNFGSQRSRIDCSVNFLGPRILAEMGLAPAGLFALNEAFHRRLSVLSPDVLETSDGQRSIWRRQLAERPGPPRDYWLIQYDLMYGQRHSAVDCFQVR